MKDYGTRVGKEGTSAIVWAVYPARVSDRDIMQDLEAQGVSLEGYPAEYPGQPYADGVHLQRGKTRVLVTQIVGIDV